MWVLLPILEATIIRATLTIALILGQHKLLQYRYPHVEEELQKSESRKVDALQMKIPDKVKAAIIGLARSAVATGKDDDIEMRDQPYLLGDSGGTNGVNTDRDDELSDHSCVLNDDVLSWMVYMRVMVCLLVPFIQLAVIIAARALLGEADFFQAAEKTFAERTYPHYAANIFNYGSRAIPRLMWFYI
jgi:hypothetical protein